MLDASRTMRHASLGSRNEVRFATFCLDVVQQIAMLAGDKEWS